MRALEQRLITWLPKVFLVFSPFLFSSCCLYSAYTLLMVTSQALSALSYVYCFYHLVNILLLCLLNPFNILFFYTAKHPLLRYQWYLQRTYHCSTFDIIFITYQNRREMTNNMTNKGNNNVSNDTSIMLFFKLTSFPSLQYQSSHPAILSWHMIVACYTVVGILCSS